MSHNQPTPSLSTEPEKSTGKGKSGRFWQVFWLTFLVISLAYAWYSFYAPSNDIAWAKDFTVAQQQAEETDQPIILFFTGKWCSPCQIMKRQVWADDQVMNTVNAAFIPVTIDVDNPNSIKILRRYGVGGTPATIITDSAGNILQQEFGGMSKAGFLNLLAQVDTPSAEGL
ncbi:MAG: thioredoxin 1 [Pseudohongiellaceae bacterium]|jgi:thioredoxin 1